MLTFFLPGSRNAGLKTSTRAGMISNAPTKQEKIEAITRKPNTLMGRNTENGKAQNPSMTDKALKLIPLPVVINVFRTASTGIRPFSLSDLYRQRKCMV